MLDQTGSDLVGPGSRRSTSDALDGHSTIASFMDTTTIIAGIGLFTTLGGSLGGIRLAAGLQRKLNRMEERRSVLDEAAICLNL